MIGAAGVSAVPMAARVVQKEGQKEDPFIKSFEEMLNSKTKEIFSENEMNLAVDEEGTV